MADCIVKAKEADRTPNWDKWRLIPYLTPLQCVALSLNIDPGKLKRQIGWPECVLNALAAAGGLDVLDHLDESQEFKDRMEVVLANLGALKSNGCASGEVDRRLFAAWVREIGWHAPPELLAMGDEHAMSAAPAAAGAANPFFKAMDGLTWAEIAITFTEAEAARVRVRDKNETFTYDAMGFRDRRRFEAKPNECWKTLKHLALVNSAYKSRSGVTIDKGAKKRMSLLRDHLKRLFRIFDDDPVVFKAGVGYEAVFNLTIEDHVIRKMREEATGHDEEGENDDEEGENDVQRAILNEPGRW